MNFLNRMCCQVKIHKGPILNSRNQLADLRLENARSICFLTISVVDYKNVANKHTSLDIRLQSKRNIVSRFVNQNIHLQCSLSRGVHSVFHSQSHWINRTVHNCNSLKWVRCFPILTHVEKLHTNGKPQISEESKDNVNERQNIYTIPNLLTVSRICATPYLGYLVLSESYHLACGIFILAGITDVLDGWIARNFKNQRSALGSFLDPLADKILISMLYVTLSMVDVIPVALTSIIIMRDIGLILAAFYIRYISLPKPITFNEYFDGTNASAQLKPLLISKINTALQFSLVVLSLGAPVFGYLDHLCLHILWYTTAATTTLSAISYVLHAKDTFQIAKPPSKTD